MRIRGEVCGVFILFVGVDGVLCIRKIIIISTQVLVVWINRQCRDFFHILRHAVACTRDLTTCMNTSFKFSNGRQTTLPWFQTPPTPHTYIIFFISETSVITSGLLCKTRLLTYCCQEMALTLLFNNRRHHHGAHFIH